MPGAALQLQQCGAPDCWEHLQCMSMHPASTCLPGSCLVVSCALCRVTFQQQPAAGGPAQSLCPTATATAAASWQVRLTAWLLRQAARPLALRDRAGRDAGGVAGPRQHPAALASVPRCPEECRRPVHRGALVSAPGALHADTSGLTSTAMRTLTLPNGYSALQAPGSRHQAVPAYACRKLCVHCTVQGMPSNVCSLEGICVHNIQFWEAHCCSLCFSGGHGCVPRPAVLQNGPDCRQRHRFLQVHKGQRCAPRSGGC